MISREGWELLINHHDFHVLCEINAKSGWFECENLEGFIKA